MKDQLNRSELDETVMRKLKDASMSDNRSADSRPVAVVVGRVVEIGDIEALGNKPGVVIETTMDQLRAHGRNLAFCEVEIRLKANAEAHGRAVARTVQPLVGHSESGGGRE